MVVHGKYFGDWNLRPIYPAQNSDELSRSIEDICQLITLFMQHEILTPVSLECFVESKSPDSVVAQMSLITLDVTNPLQLTKESYWRHLFFELSQDLTILPYSIEIKGTTVLIDEGKPYISRDAVNLYVNFEGNAIDFRITTEATDWLPYRADERGGINPDYAANADRLEAAFRQFIDTRNFTVIVETNESVYNLNNPLRLENPRFAKYEGVEEIVLFNSDGKHIGGYNPVSNFIE